MNQTIKATVTRRFGYYIPKDNETIDFLVYKKPANEEVVAELHEMTKVVSCLQPIIFAFKIVERNHQELAEALESHQSHLNNSPTTINTNFITANLTGYVLTAQKITNFLSSASAFLTQAEKQLKRIHGASSQEFHIWNTQRKDLHATCFAYRFLYELRNFSQHQNLPLSSLHVNGSRPSEDAPLLFETKALILRDRLFANEYKWNKNLATEIRNQPAEFDLPPLTIEYLRCLHQLCLAALSLQSLQLAECANYLNVLYKTLNIPAGAMPVVFVGEPAIEGTPPSKFEAIPTPQLEWILRKYDELLNT